MPREPQYIYGIELKAAHKVSWRDEFNALVRLWTQDKTGELSDIPDFVVLDPTNNVSRPSLWRTMPRDSWFEQMNGALDNPVTPQAACHPDDLRWLRSLTGLSQVVFARFMGSSQAELSVREAGSRIITRPWLSKAQTALMELLCGKEPIHMRTPMDYSGSPSTMLTQAREATIAEAARVVRWTEMERLSADDWEAKRL